MKRNLLPLVAAGLGLATGWAQEVTYSPFGPRGEGGTKNGQTMTIGAGGSVFELDAFFSAEGLDLNGAKPGRAAQLSSDGLPGGLNFSFTPRLTPDGDLVLTYVLTNGTAGAFTNAQFMFLLDAEIDQETNTFFNEYGGVEGSAGLGAGDVLADSWQIDEPGFAGGQLFGNLYAGVLSNSNAIPVGASNDVALALGFALGEVLAGNSVGVAIEVSGRGNSLGSLRLVQRDAGGSATTVTLSGLVATLAGTIFRDGNRNGSPDLNLNEGLANVTLRLLAGTNVVGQVATDSRGNYTFSTPPPGTYTLAVEAGTVPGGLTLTVDPDGVKDGITTLAVVPGELTIRNWGYEAPVVSGLANVTAQAGLNFQWRLYQPGGWLIGRLSITNQSGGVSFGSPFQLGLFSSTNYWLAHPASGTVGSGAPYVDLTAALEAALAAQGRSVLGPGQAVTVDGVEVYSRDRSAPPTSLFELWAAQQ